MKRIILTVLLTVLCIGSSFSAILDQQVEAEEKDKINLLQYNRIYPPNNFQGFQSSFNGTCYNLNDCKFGYTCNIQTYRCACVLGTQQQDFNKLNLLGYILKTFQPKYLILYLFKARESWTDASIVLETGKCTRESAI